MNRRLAALLFAALSAAGAPSRARAGEPVQVASFDDPADDATGPGTYSAPTGPGFTDGDFDLRRFTVSTDGDDVLFAVTLGAAFRRPDVTQRENSSELQLWNSIYLQNIDIYIDTDRSSPAGFTACIPGRRVAFEPGRSWKSAVVLTPQPGPARAIAEEVLGRGAAVHVIFAQGLQTSGRTITARVPALALGGPPRRNWAYSVHVSGAAWERSFGVLDRVRGTREANAFTMPVLPVAELWAFGGAPAEGNSYPRVLDVLLPAWADQKAVLGSYERDGALARVPFVDLDSFSQGPRISATAAGSAGAASGASGPAAAGTADSPASKKLSLALAPAAPPAKAKEGVELKVSFVAGEMISLTGPSSSLKPMQFGRVLGPDGALVARVVVVQVVEGGVVVNAVENREQIVAGAKVRFEAP